MTIILLSNGTYFAHSSRFHLRRIVYKFESVWNIHDADWVTDAELKEGRSSPIIAQFYDLDAAFHYLSRIASGELQSVPMVDQYKDGNWPALEQRITDAGL
jgi:hypothetical protein